MYVLERILGQKQPVGTVAHRGTAVEDGVTVGLLDPGASIGSCIEAALKKYDTVSALSSDARREDHRETIPAMVTTALAELRPMAFQVERRALSSGARRGSSIRLSGISITTGWEQHGILIDLKTSEKLPSSIKIGHARQSRLMYGDERQHRWSRRLHHAKETRDLQR